LRRAIQDGYCLLAMDGAAVSHAVEANVQFTLVDDWLDADSIIVTKRQARAWERTWFSKERAGFELGGICWPEIDREAMYWFWRDVSLGLAMIRSFKAANIRELLLFRRAVARSKVFYGSSETISDLWQAQMEDIVEIEEIPTREARLRRWLARFRAAARPFRFVAGWRGPTQPRRGVFCLDAPGGQSLEDSIVFGANPGEVFRFSSVLQKLGREYSGKLRGFVLSQSQKAVCEAAQEWEMPVFPQPKPREVEESLGDRFLRAFSDIRAGCCDEPLSAVLDVLPHHFEYFCSVRWPSLIAQFRAWTDLLEKDRPRVVIVSSLQDGESRLPAVAARSLGIPTLSIPHGGDVNRVQDVWVDQVAVGFSVPQEAFSLDNAPNAQRVRCRDLVVENEYPYISWNGGETTDRLMILGLTSPVSHDGCLSPEIAPRSQIGALEVLANPPRRLINQIDIKIKPHPGFPDSGILTAAGVAQEQCLKPQTELNQALERCDLVVAVNYSGTGLLHACRAGKPVVFFWTDPMIGQTDPYAFADYYLPAGTLVGNPDDLWKIIGECISDPGETEKLRARARSFYLENMDGRAFPTLGTVLRQYGGAIGPAGSCSPGGVP